MYLATHLTSFCFFAAAALPIMQPQESREPTASRNADEVKTDVRVYDLDYANANDVARACQTANLPVRVSANSRERWLLASGSAEDLDNLEGIIERLERAAARKPPPPEKTTLIVKLEHASARETASALSSLLFSSRTRMAVDGRSNSLIITGDPETVRTAVELIEQLDHPGAPSVVEPTGALDLSFYFLRGSIGVASRGGNTALPKSLRAVADALGDSGFANLELMSPARLVADPSAGFEYSWKIATSDGGSLQFYLQGQVNYDEPETVSADIQAVVEVGPSSQPDQGVVVLGAVFQIETSLTVALDEYLVLAASPASTADGDAIVLVMKVSQR